MYHVIEKDNPHAVHCITWSAARARAWIERYGNSGMFTDKSLHADSFTVKRIQS